jgi:hypothetical protein
MDYKSLWHAQVCKRTKYTRPWFLKNWGAMKHDWAKFVGCYNFIVVVNEFKSFIEDII